jgi:hypothetical protein
MLRIHHVSFQDDLAASKIHLVAYHDPRRIAVSLSVIWELVYWNRQMMIWRRYKERAVDLCSFIF